MLIKGIVEEQLNYGFDTNVSSTESEDQQDPSAPEWIEKEGRRRKQLKEEETKKRMMRTIVDGELGKFDRPEGDPLECPICLVEVNIGAVFPCQHQFCRDCSINSLAKNPACPICKMDVIGYVREVRRNGESAAVRNLLHHPQS